MPGPHETRPSPRIIVSQVTTKWGPGQMKTENYPDGLNIVLHSRTKHQNSSPSHLRPHMEWWPSGDDLSWYCCCLSALARNKDISTGYPRALGTAINKYQGNAAGVAEVSVVILQSVYGGWQFLWLLRFVGMSLRFSGFILRRNVNVEWKMTPITSGSIPISELSPHPRYLVIDSKHIYHGYHGIGAILTHTDPIFTAMIR